MTLFCLCQLSFVHDFNILTFTRYTNQYCYCVSSIWKHLSLSHSHCRLLSFMLNCSKLLFLLLFRQHIFYTDCAKVACPLSFLYRSLFIHELRRSICNFERKMGLFRKYKYKTMYLNDTDMRRYMTIYLNDTNLLKMRFMNWAYLWIRGWWCAYDLNLCWLPLSYLGSPIPNGLIEYSGIPDTGRLLKCLCSLSWFLDSVAWKTGALFKSGVAWPSKPVECRWNEVLSAPELEVEGTWTGWRKPRRARYGQTSELLAALEWSPVAWSS